MTPKAPDLAKALVSPMPFHLPFAPSPFAWLVGIVTIWALLLFLGHVLQDTTMGRWLLLAVPTCLIQSVLFLLLMAIHIGAPLISSVTMRDVLIGLVWGAAFDLVMVLLCFYPVFRWQLAEAETPLAPFRPTIIYNHGDRRPTTGKLPTGKTAPRYGITTGNRPMHTRTRKSLPKRKLRNPWPKNR